MKAVDANLLNLLKVTSQFEVPIYQRTYAWGDDECEQLWRDILRAGRADDLGAHFTGSVVYVEKAAGTQTNQAPNLIIDGQQRVTTVTLLLATLATVLEQEGRSEPIRGFSPAQIRDQYLTDPYAEGADRYKLLLSHGDREALFSVIDGSAPTNYESSRVLVNAEFFRKKLNDEILDLADVCRGLLKLQVVDVKLQLGIDHPQLVFEAMNSTGKKLSQADLIRNYVLMDLPADEQARLWRTSWRPMEIEFAEAGAEGEFDNFVRHYLTSITGQIPRIGDIYDAYKDYATIQRSKGDDITTLVTELRDYARRYAAIALRGEQDRELKSAFDELAEIRADVVYPFLLEVYTDYELGILAKAEVLEIVGMVTSYIIRRGVAGYATNSLNRTFQTFWRALRKDRYIESVQAHFLRMDGYRTFPNDADFEEKLKSFDVYHYQRRSYFLRSLENHGRKEPVPTDEYTIEHILPQNPDLRQEWRDDLGDDWAEVQGKYLHTLGNLTLTGYNSEYSDRPFLEKRDMDGGFRESPLRLNRGIGQLDRWDETAIVGRAARLASLALAIWPRPVLTAEQIAAYAQPRAESEYSVEDHPYLLQGPRKRQFERLREEVLAFDPSVEMTFLKVRVSFRAESVFLDVVPQASRLLLVLNIPLSALRDEHGLGRDVSRIGHWGVGPTQVAFDDHVDPAYIVGLIRQAYEYQLPSSDQ